MLSSKQIYQAPPPASKCTPKFSAPAQQTTLRGVFTDGTITARHGGAKLFLLKDPHPGGMHKKYLLPCIPQRVKSFCRDPGPTPAVTRIDARLIFPDQPANPGCVIYYQSFMMNNGPGSDKMFLACLSSYPRIRVRGFHPRRPSCIIGGSPSRGFRVWINELSTPHQESGSSTFPPSKSQLRPPPSSDLVYHYLTPSTRKKLLLPALGVVHRVL